MIISSFVFIVFCALGRKDTKSPCAWCNIPQEQQNVYILPSYGCCYSLSYSTLSCLRISHVTRYYSEKMPYFKNNAPRLFSRNVTQVTRLEFINAYLLTLGYKVQSSMPVLISRSLRFEFQFGQYPLRLMTCNFKSRVSSEFLPYR